MPGENDDNPCNGPMYPAVQEMIAFVQFDAPDGGGGVAAAEKHSTAQISVTERLYGDALQRAESKKAREKQQGKVKEAFSPDMSETAGYNKAHHHDSTTSNEHGTVADRLYQDALLRAEQTKEHNGKAKESEHVLTEPFKPDLSESADYRQKHPVVGRQKPVSERLFEDALHGRDKTTRHEDELKGEETHIKKKKAHTHPFASDFDPKADYCRRMDTSLSVDGGSVERGLYEDSSISSAPFEPTANKCECGNIVQIDLDREEQIHHPSSAFDGSAKFSPDIKESQKALPSPLNVRVHGEQSKSVFDRLFRDREQRERRKAMQRNQKKLEEDRELTFQPKTNVHHHHQKGATKNGGRREQKHVCDRCKMEESKEERNMYQEILENEIKLTSEEASEEIDDMLLLDPGGTFASLAIQK